MMRDYERQLIEGLPKEEADRLIRAVNGINAICRLPRFGESQYVITEVRRDD